MFACLMVCRESRMVTQVGYSVIGRSRDRVTLCAVCTIYMEMRSAGFFVEPQNQVYGLSVVWHQNHWDGFLQFGLKTGGDGFFWFGLKTGGSNFPVWASKPAAPIW
jgi:hypothetical protein